MDEIFHVGKCKSIWNPPSLQPSLYFLPGWCDTLAGGQKRSDCLCPVCRRASSRRQQLGSSGLDFCFYRYSPISPISHVSCLSPHSPHGDVPVFPLGIFLHFLTLKSARWQLYELRRAVDIHPYSNSCLLKYPMYVTLLHWISVTCKHTAVQDREQQSDIWTSKMD